MRPGSPPWETPKMARSFTVLQLNDAYELPARASPEPSPWEVPRAWCVPPGKGNVPPLPPPVPPALPLNFGHLSLSE